MRDEVYSYVAWHAQEGLDEEVDEVDLAHNLTVQMIHDAKMKNLDFVEFSAIVNEVFAALKIPRETLRIVMES